MMVDKIRVIIKRPDSKHYVTNISNSLENLQKTVEGHIETVTLLKDVVIICNEEGRLRGLPYNCNVCGIDFVGTIIFAGIKDDELDDCPIKFNFFKLLFKNLF